MTDRVDSTVIPFPSVRRAHSWRRDGNVSTEDIDRLVWAICPYMRSGQPCEHCPERERDENDVAFIRGCRLAAHEVINICQTGNPWRKP